MFLSRAARKVDTKIVLRGTLAALFFAANGAYADPKVPAYIQNKYGLPCAPDCTLCHANDRGGFANYRTITVNGVQKGGFGVTMKNFGLNPLDPSTWDSSFAAAEQGKSDTDADGTPDVEELMN